MRTYYPKHSFLEGFEVEIFKLVSYSATPEQWKEWLRVPLEHAAARGNLILFNNLLGAGADGSARYRGCEDRTLLDAAAVGGNEGIVSALLESGAQPDVNVVSCSSKRSALYTATVLGHEAVARRLVIAGADVNFQDPVHKSSVLYEATLGGQERLVAELLLGGADLSYRDGDGSMSSLHFAAEAGFDEAASTLLLRGADKDALDDDEETPLMWAAKEGNLSVVKTLLAAGADVSIRGTHGYSALDYAAEIGFGDAIEAIVEHGADVNDRDDDGYTALHTAAQSDQAGAINLLIEAGADIELRKDDGEAPLAYAAYHGSCNAMLALLQHGAKVDVRNTYGGTPRHSACWGRSKGLEAAVDLLLRWGADETVWNYEGKSPAKGLDVGNGGDVDNPCTRDEIKRTRLLLAHAPADRAWRRRGWLVMLCSRNSKARAGNRSSDGHGAAGESGGAEAARGEGVADKGAGVELEAKDGERFSDRKAGQLELDVEGVVRTASNDGCTAGAEGSEEGLRLEMLPWLGLGLEGVFRTVVGFL